MNIANVQFKDDDRNEDENCDKNLCKKCHFAHRVVEASHFELAHLFH